MGDDYAVAVKAYENAVRENTKINKRIAEALERIAKALEDR